MRCCLAFLKSLPAKQQHKTLGQILRLYLEADTKALGYKMRLKANKKGSRLRLEAKALD